MRLCQKIELHPKSWTKNFLGAVHYDTASFLIYGVAGYSMGKLVSFSYEGMHAP